MSAPIAEFNSSIDMSAPDEIIVAANKPCDLTHKYDLDHIKLIRHDEVLARISQDTFLWSIAMDPPMSFSHARTKIAEITGLSTLKSAYVPDFTFQLIGDYGVDNIFLVHRICITCDDFSSLKDTKSVHMLDHFDMTSNNGIDYTQRLPNK